METLQPNLHRLLEPRSVAIVGASSNKHKPGGRVVRYLQEYGYEGSIYPVNPVHHELAGLPCYPSLTAIGQAVDAVVITVPASEVPDVVAEVIRIGAGGAIVYSSGFSELGTPEGAELHRRLAEMIRTSGLPVIGPNTAGMVNVGAKCNLCFGIMFEDQPPLRLGGVSLVTQGGGAGGLLFPLARELGVDFSYWLNSGNEAGLQVGDTIGYLAEDPATKVIIGTIEGIRDAGRVLAATTAANRNGKPVILLKTGRTQAGARVVASHTGAVAGHDRLTEAFFRKAGIVPADDVWDLMGAAQVLKDGRISRGPNIAVVTTSNSIGAMIADQADRLGFQLATLSDATIAALERTLPPYVQAGNPADVANLPALDPHLIGKAADLVLADDQADNLVIYMMLSIGHEVDVLCAQIIEVFRRTEKLLVVVLTGPPTKAAELLCAAGVPTFRTTTEALRALAAAWQAARVRPYDGRPLHPPAAPSAGARRTLNEADSAALVARYGIPVARSLVAASPEEAAMVAADIGFPVAVKILAADIPHKSDAGGVQLDLGSGDAVQRAATRVLDNARQAHPGARLDGILVQEMCPRGVEVVVGATRDPVYGPSVLFGLGGVTMEVLNDVAMAISPLTRAEAQDLVRRVRSFVLLDGFRGAPPADVAAVVDLILAVDRLMQEQPQVQELDLNPVLVYPAGRGVKVVDTVVVSIS